MTPADNTPIDATTRILDAALSVFCTQGYQASIDAVANEAQVARQTIYNHFASKQDLFEAALNRSGEEMFAKLDDANASLEQKLMRFGIEMRSKMFCPECINLHRLLINEAPRFPDLAAQFFKGRTEKVGSRLAALFNAEIAAQRFLPADPAELAHWYIDLLISYDRTRMLFGGNAPSTDSEPAYVGRVTEFFLRACRSPHINH